MTVSFIICCVYFFIFVGLHSILALGFFLEWRRDRRTTVAADKSPEEQVSLIIPVRNESRRIEGLLHSLLLQDYPAEIIFVDDCSDDASPAMLARFLQDAPQHGIHNCRVITLNENPGPNRKQYALCAGIAQSQGEFLLFTDADCELPPGWIKAMVSRMNNETAGAVIGPVFKKKEGKGFFCLYQSYDHLMRYYYLAASIGLGAAGGGFGNNFIIRRAALEAVGGYSAVPLTSTEDAALISLIRRHGKYSVRAVTHPDAAVFTAAEKNWRNFTGQTLRWNNGGVFSPDTSTRFNYNLLMLLISAGILAIPFLPFFPCLWPLPLGVLLSMIINTAAVFSLFFIKLPPGGPLNLGYVLTLLFTPVYFTLMTFMGYFRVKTTWKGEKLSV